LTLGAPVDFLVLGPLELVVDGVPARLTARRQRALLVALLLRAGTVVSADSLIEALWGDDRPDSAASVLRLYVSNVRRCLPPGRLVTRSPGYVLIVKEGELDSERFEALFADGRRTLAEGRPRLARSLLGRALALWRGPALADLGGESFAREAADRLDELRLQCIEERVAADLELGLHREVLAELELLVATHPLRDRLRGQLMIALYRSGRQADALACYRRGRDVLVQEYGLDPGAELRELERRILQQDESLDLALIVGHSTERRRVPVPATGTIGRDREIAEVRERLLSGTGRLVTLVGPGGVGKTRLAVESAALLGEELADGALLVELAEVHDPSRLLESIGHALGLRPPNGSSWQEAIADHLRTLELLLVLDNLEHLVNGVAPLVELLALAPRVRVLATSTTVLRLSGEQIQIVAPLDRPAALELFIRQAIAAGFPEAIPADRVDTLELICERLEGSPLAIELAAPWLRVLSPEELLSRMDSRLSVLRDGPRDTALRHRTLRATIDWSFELLAPDVQRVFTQLSVFAGGFSLDSMAAVTGSEAALGQLEALVTASMVQAMGGRYRLLEVMRDYAAERLGNDLGPRSRHAAHFAELAATAEPQLSGSDQTEWLARLDIEHDNLRVALDWLTVGEDTAAAELHMAAALGRFWYVRGHIGEGLSRLQHAIDRAGAEDDPSLAKALRAASALAVIQGDYALANELANRSLSTYRKLGDSAGAARALSNLGAILHAQGELEVAAATLEQCILECDELGEDRLLALAQNNRGDVALSQRDLDSAAAHFAQSLAILQKLGDSANVARSLYNLGAVAVEQNRLEDARSLLAQSITLSERVGDYEDLAWCLIALAAVASRTQRAYDGARMLGFTLALLQQIGATMKPFEQSLYEHTREALHSALGGAEFDTALSEGDRLGLSDAVILASAITVSESLSDAGTAPSERHAGLLRTHRRAGQPAR
jgi:predicted ATPase/DNA-binding SARP family transcriptional activator